MKNINKFWLSLIVIIALCNYTSAQTSLGSSKNFMNKLKTQLVSNSARGASTAISLKVAEGVKDFEGKINYKKSDATSEFLIGEIKNIPESSFYVRAIDKSLEGHIILKATKEAYKYYSDENGNAYVSKVDINSLICIDYANVPQDPKSQSDEKPVQMKIAAALLNLQSLPGAAGCVMLDFDGYNMPAGNLWNNGNAINAAPSGASDAQIQEQWEIVSEDYRPFNINITTNEAVFNSYPKNRRMRVVITPTTTASPRAGGVAYIGSFNWDNDVPCWVFYNGKTGGEGCSHEVGHTFDLQHDGRSNPKEEYYGGLANTSWAPIMGVSYYKPVTQWSKGEYTASSSKQDDVAIISGSKFGVGYRGDDYGNTIATANSLTYNTTGVVNQKNGIITSEADLDFFAFTTGGGSVVLNINTVSRHGDLDIIVRLYTSSGTGIGTFTNTASGALNATLTANLGAGKYFISVDGTGAGDPVNGGGYSAYASLGSYSITGKIPPGGVAGGTAIVYQHCAYGGYAITLPVGDYNLGQLQAKGLLNDDISSLKVQSGYEIVVYQHDGFGGTSLTFTADDDCLIDNGFNDFVSSIKVRAKRVSSVISNPVVANNFDIPINAYPNPVETSLSFTKDITNADVEIVNIQVPGSVFKGKVSNNNLDVSNLKSGIYSITIEKDGKRSSTRFIKK
jgi:Secretion system C-terminal sorting domain